MEKSEIIKIVIQYLNDKGYKEVGSKLEEESNVGLESKHIKNLKKLINRNIYEEAIQIILQNCSRNDQIFIIPKMRIMQVFHSLTENIDKPDKAETVEMLRKICSSQEDYDKDCALEKCSSLIFINKKTDLLKSMREISPRVYSNETLIEYIENTLSKSRSLLKTLQPKSLETMLDVVVKNQIRNCLFHTAGDMKMRNFHKGQEFSYFSDHRCGKTNIPYKCIFTIERHEEEITNLIPSDSGRYFSAILKNNFVAVYQMVVNKEKFQDTLQIQFTSLIKAHENQITSLQWNRAEDKILTAGKDKTIKIFDIFTGQCKLKIENIATMVNSAIFIENETKILAACLSQKLSCWEIKENSKLSDTTYTSTIIDSHTMALINEIIYSEYNNLIILVAPTIKAVILYDFATKSQIHKICINDTIVSTAISKTDKGVHLLINSSTSTPVITLWNLSTFSEVRKFFGHRQERLTTKCAFGGSFENFILSGSDNKEIYIWNRNASVPISIIKAHSSCVNTVFWPFNKDFSSFLISGSDDHTIKVFSNNEFSKAIFTGESDSDKGCWGKKLEEERKSNFTINVNAIDGDNLEVRIPGEGDSIENSGENENENENENSENENDFSHDDSMDLS